MHQAIVDPATFDVEDSDEEDDIIRNIGSSSISTLEAIKTKLVRRLSKASNSGRHPQRSVVGNSSEELARRAELKRLMHKRIQEELKSEEEVVTPGDLVQSHNQESGSQSGLPGGGPRDTIEFSVDEMNEIRDNGFKYTSRDGIALALPVDRTQALALGRRSSCLESTCRSGDTIGTENHAAPNERGSISQVPPSPELCPVNLLSPRGLDSEHSWCLSYSHSHLASVLGIQEDSAHQPSECNAADDGVPEEEVPKDGSDSRTEEKPANPKENATGQDSSDSAEQPHRSPRPGGIDPASEQGVKSDDKEQQDSDTALYQDSSLDLWLRSQELQSSLSSSTQRSRSTALGKLRESYSRDMEAMATGDAVKPHTALALPEVHQDAATRHHLPCAWLQSHETQADAKKTNDLAEANTPNVTGTGNNHILTLDQPPTDAHEESSSHYMSSRYTTIPNSAQSSHRSSLRSLVELFGSSKGASIFSPFSPFYRPTTQDRRTETDESGVSSYKTAKNALPAIHTAVVMPMRAGKRSTSFDKDKKPHVEESATGKWKRALRTEAERRQARRRDSLSKLYTHDPEEDQACVLTNEHETTKHIRENSTADNTDDDHPSPRAYSPMSVGNTTLKPPVDIQRNRTPVIDISGRLFRTWSRQLSRTPSPQGPPAVHVVGELELLPMQGGYKDVQALEDQIETMKNGSSRAEGKPRNPSILGVRLIQDVQNLRCGNDDAHTSDANEDPAALPPHRPPPVVSCTVSGTTAKRSEAPPSHVSYDDCVPKHMLDENDSIKSHDTVLVKRSKSHVSRRSGPAVTNDRARYMTWNGWSRRQPVLLQSTIDFGAELDDMLTAARAKAMQAGSGEEMQKATAV
ncbi:hypothetical protein DL766_009669 [Monosporascus sp. MC13-8B]|uniref:Uncharacterized protein n=1 Tax=Monosporascus cannonballus TaxID=155416 RepID=A0ABY0H604_9PEZI|nr:hypothetical protein DL763_009335 [Monosporascus cannonballus]RYO84946.1 hypothetical protein DL762_005411 [Monosporascus cannonballus]RYP14479.1 hypothetical protein DL766_009669 [Monosporascus sp. MC13-8B]